MSESLKLNINLFIVVALLSSAVFWVILSFYQELNCIKTNGWFARSGAVLVLASLWSGFITSPHVRNTELPDFASRYRAARADTEPPDSHWTAKVGLSKILLAIELVLALSGTLIWAYGDLWLSSCDQV